MALSDRDTHRALISQEIAELALIAARNGATLNAHFEAARLLRQYPKCGWNRQELTDIIAKDAASRGVAIEFP